MNDVFQDAHTQAMEVRATTAEGRDNAGPFYPSSNYLVHQGNVLAQIIWPTRMMF